MSEVKLPEVKMSEPILSGKNTIGKNVIGKNVRGIDLVCLKREFPRVQMTNTNHSTESTDRLANLK